MFLAVTTTPTERDLSATWGPSVGLRGLLRTELPHLLLSTVLRPLSSFLRGCSHPADRVPVGGGCPAPETRRPPQAGTRRHPPNGTHRAGAREVGEEADQPGSRGCSQNGLRALVLSAPKSPPFPQEKKCKQICNHRPGRGTWYLTGCAEDSTSGDVREEV